MSSSSFNSSTKKITVDQTIINNAVACDNSLVIQGNTVSGDKAGEEFMNLIGSFVRNKKRKTGEQKRTYFQSVLKYNGKRGREFKVFKLHKSKKDALIDVVKWVNETELDLDITNMNKTYVVKSDHDNTVKIRNYNILPESALYSMIILLKEVDGARPMDVDVLEHEIDI